VRSETNKSINRSISMRTLKFWTYENVAILILGLGGGVAALDAQTLFYLSPFLAKDIHLNNAQIGLVASVALLTWALSGYVTGSLSDRQGSRKRFLIGGFFMFAVCSVLSGLANSFLLLFCARALMGLAEGPVIPVTQAIMMAESSPHRRGINMGIVQNLGAQLIGSMFGPIVLVYLATAFSWHVAFYAAALPGVIVAMLVALFVREPPRQPATMVHSETTLLRQMIRLLKYHNIRVCMILSCLIVGWYFLVLTFLPLYCVRVLQMSPERMSIVMACAGGAGVVSAILVPLVSDRVGRRPAICCFSILGVSAALAPIHFASSYPLLLVLIFVGFMTLGTCPLFMATVPLESVHSHDTAASAGIIIGVGQILGGFCGPTLAGVLADRFSLAVPLEIAGGAAALAAVVALRLQETAPRKTGAWMRDQRGLLTAVDN
jgi:ACS family hexuronate transporter-like MFS transporter